MVRFYSKKCRWPSEGGLRDRQNKALSLKEAVLKPHKQAVLTLHGAVLAIDLNPTNTLQPNELGKG